MRVRQPFKKLAFREIFTVAEESCVELSLLKNEKLANNHYFRGLSMSKRTQLYFAEIFHSSRANSALIFVIRLSGKPYRFKIFMRHLDRAVEKETDVSVNVFVEVSLKKQNSNMQQNYCQK